MHSVILAGLSLTLSFLFVGFAFAEPIQFKLDQEEIRLETDGRAWSIASQQDAGSKGIFEYTAAGETKDSWSELVTINYFRGMQGDDLIRRLIDFTKRGLESQCAEVKWKSIFITSKSALYYWTAKTCSGAPDQSELARALIGKNALFVFHYANKEVPMPARKFEVWKENLEKISVKEG